MNRILYVLLLFSGLMQWGCIRPVPRTEKNPPVSTPAADSAKAASEPFDAVQLGGDVFEAELGKKEAKSSRETLGYRVQIAALGDENAANTLRAQVVTEFRMPVYVSHEAPFWFVRMGDFRTITEAEEAKKEAIRKGYDGARVVEDNIAIGE
jgi:cell division septation protein DedD